MRRGRPSVRPGSPQPDSDWALFKWGAGPRPNQPKAAQCTCARVKRSSRDGGVQEVHLARHLQMIELRER